MSAAGAALNLPLAGSPPAPEFATGWQAPVAAPASPAQASEPDAAVWWRLRAARIDNVIVWAMLIAAGWALGLSPSTAGGLVTFFCLHWGLQFLYHFVLEIRDGQTVGKRRYGVKVVRLDGETPGTGAIALRSLFRAVDAFPGLYPSGLFCMWQTGRSRRQRIGDVVAGTTVVRVDGGQRRSASSRRTLPVVALLSLALSGLAVAAVAQQVNHAPRQMENTIEQACFNNTNGHEDCRCFYEVMRDRAGYDTPERWIDLDRRLRVAHTTGDYSAVPPAYNAAVAACRIG
jgi:uncharacterized RDD family membrane protein YckC